MKFKIKTFDIPKIGDRKTIIKFAWFPKKIDNIILWLEKYECTYEFKWDSFYNSYYWEVIYKSNCKNHKINKQN